MHLKKTNDDDHEMILNTLYFRGGPVRGSPRRLIMAFGRDRLRL